MADLTTQAFPSAGIIRIRYAGRECVILLSALNSELPGAFPQLLVSIGEGR